MRVTIVRTDDLVIVNGLGRNIDCKSLPEDIHVVQWYDTQGEVEWRGENSGDVNLPIDSLAPYQSLLDAYEEQAREEAEAEEAMRNDPRLALDEMVLQVDQLNREKNLEDFTFEGHLYTSDAESIQGVAIEASGMVQTEPVPVPGGVWKTAEYDEVTLAPVYIPLTCAEFALFKTTFFMRSSTNFGVKEFHKNNLKTLYTSEATAEEIRAYDYTQGWV